MNIIISSSLCTKWSFKFPSNPWQTVSRMYWRFMNCCSSKILLIQLFCLSSLWLIYFYFRLIFKFILISPTERRTLYSLNLLHSFSLIQTQLIYCFHYTNEEAWSKIDLRKKITWHSLNWFTVEFYLSFPELFQYWWLYFPLCTVAVDICQKCLTVNSRYFNRIKVVGVQKCIKSWVSVNFNLQSKNHSHEIFLTA